MKRAIDTFIRIITWIAILGLLGSYTSPYVNPNTFYVSSLLGLAYHYLLIVNLVLLLYWIARWKKITWLILFVLIAGYPFMRTYYGMNGKISEETPHDISLLSYNVRQMDIYGWSKQKETPQQMEDYINRFPGNLVCLQEVPQQNGIFQKFPSYPYYYTQKDVAILSRTPLINTGFIDFDKKYTAACIYADVAIPGDTIRVYCVHLESYRLGDKDRKLLQKLSEGKGQAISDEVHSIVSLLIAANKNRARQAGIIKKHMNQSPYPVILCGDFNDTPLSYTYSTLDDGMKDSFVEKGRGLGNTYIGEFPSFRIDHILHSSSFETVSYLRDTVRFSDHYPIQSKLRKIDD